MSRRTLAALAALATILVAAGCAPPSATRPAADRPVVTGEPPPAFREGVTAAYRVTPGDSRVTALVYRAGPLADVGHNHTVATSRITGCALVNAAGATWVGLRLAVDDLEVDRAEDRARAGDGFGSGITEGDKTATRQNMRGEAVLAAASHPHVRFRGVLEPGAREVAGRITVRDVTRPVTLSATVERTGGTVRATGRGSLMQTDFGITPFSVLMGALRVADQVDLRYRLTLTAHDPATACPPEKGVEKGVGDN